MEHTAGFLGIKLLVLKPATTSHFTTQAMRLDFDRFIAFPQGRIVRNGLDTVSQTQVESASLIRIFVPMMMLLIGRASAWLCGHLAIGCLSV
jgi:hypothetical protein